MAARLQTTELVKQMTGKNTTNGWDVVVSYNEDQINKLLELRAKDVDALTKIEFQTEFKKSMFDKNMSKRDWKVQLTKPVLKFIGNNGRIRLTHKFGGSVTEGTQTATIPDLWAVQIETDLSNVKGTLGDPSKPATSNFVPASNASQSAAPSNSVVQISNDNASAQAVCINLADSNIDLKFVDLNDPNATIPDDMSVIQNTLRSQINKAAGFQYYVAGLNNVYTPAAGSDLLKPKTFCFTCKGGIAADKTPGTLSMWIGVEGGEAGTRPTGNANSITFHPADDDVSPIPKDSSASVIFSHRLMANYIVSALKANGNYDDFSVTSQVGNPGIEIKGKCKKKIRKVLKQFEKNGKYVPPLAWEWEFYQDLNFDMHDATTTFKFGKQDNLRDISVVYLSDEISLMWFRTTMTIASGNPESKILRVKFTHGGSGSWSDERTPKTKNPNLLKLTLTLPAKMQTKDPKVTEKILFWDKDNAEAPEHYKNIDLDMPTMNMDLKGLDYFLTTNLLLPGAHLFIADDPSGKRGANFGLFMPRDVLLTGQVATEIKGV